MGLFDKLTRLGSDVITMPFSIAKDVVTFGGVLTDENEPSTVKKLKKIVDDLDELAE